MKYPALAVANYFLDSGWKEGAAIDPLKMQKLVYFAHGWNLGLYGEALINEPVQAWQYGPVIPSVYQAFKKFGSDAISFPAFFRLDGDTGGITAPQIPRHDARTRSLLDRVWQVFKGFSGLQLSDMTHKPGTPWDQAYNEGSQDCAIPDSLIRAYFARQANNRDSSPDTRASSSPGKKKEETATAVAAARA